LLACTQFSFVTRWHLTATVSKKQTNSNSWNNREDIEAAEEAPDEEGKTRMKSLEVRFL